MELLASLMRTQEGDCCELTMGVESNSVNIFFFSFEVCAKHLSYINPLTCQAAYQTTHLLLLLLLLLLIIMLCTLRKQQQTFLGKAACCFSLRNTTTCYVNAYIALAVLFSPNQIYLRFFVSMQTLIAA
jgi:hypothetical protein